MLMRFVKKKIITGSDRLIGQCGHCNKTIVLDEYVVCNDKPTKINCFYCDTNFLILKTNKNKNTFSFRVEKEPV